MQLIFAGGEHSPFILPEGATAIGAAADAHVVLARPGVAPVHARIERRGERVQVQPCAEPVRLNGQPLREAMVLKSGDTLEFASVRCRLVKEHVGGGDRNTRIRSTVPRYVLRGVSGPTFGRNFGIEGALTLGRQADCEICIPLGEISRKHVRLKPTVDGVLVEDLDSANGTSINGKRIHNGVLQPGDELALDTVRFMLLAPTSDASAATSVPTLRRFPATAIALLVALAILLGLLILKALGIAGI